VDTTSSLVLEQLYSFLESLVLGVALGASFDLYRAIRLQGRRRSVTALSVLTDCLFWIVAAAACIAVIIARRWGEMYVYNYLSIAGGFIGYIYFISRFLLPLWIRLFGFILNFLISLVRFLLKVVSVFTSPFRWFGRRAGRAAGRSRKIFSELFSRIPGCFRRRTS
jgi:spore cortex biosynthesis protein YabQ